MRLGNFSVSLAVKDIGASRAFYEKLGFKVILGEQAKKWLILQNETSTIGLFQGAFPKNTLTFNPGWDRSAKALSDFDDVREIQRELKSQGLELMTVADDSTKGPASLMLIDPDGNPVLIDQHVPSPPVKNEVDSVKQTATGIGGVFFKAENPAKLAAWYKEHLGLSIDGQWNGCKFNWREDADPTKAGVTVWSTFKADTKYFGDGKQGHMINYRVDNLEKMLAQLKREGVWVDPKTQASEFGKFGWAKDGEGNRIELWEPPAEQPAK